MHRQPRWALLLVTAAALTGCSNRTAPPSQSDEGARATSGALSASAPTPAPTTITVAFPTGAKIGTTILSANGELRLGERATVGQSGDTLAVANLGHDGTHVEESGTVHGNVSSVASVLLERGAQVTGNVQSAAGVVRQHGVVVGGTVTPNKAFGTTPTSFQVTLPATNAGDVRLHHHDARTLAPGAYGDLSAEAGATLSLRSGTYYFRSFSTERGATVALDESAGPVIVYDTGAASLGATWAASGSKTGTNLLFVALGRGEGCGEGDPRHGEHGDRGAGDWGDDGGDVVVGSPLAGTIVATERRVDLERVGAPHVGQVFAHDIDLDEGQTILLGGFDWGYFCPLGDSDGDGVTDCTDACPLDPNKTTPQVCGCGVSETDSDHDGLPDCVDQCPKDPTKSVPGQCGCANAPAPAGTTCNDGICSGVAGSSFTCDGAGQCGSPSACAPDPACVAKVFNETVYWICPGPATWSQAQAKCDATAGQSLVEIDSRLEDAVLADLVKTPSWTGANDQGAAGTWTWAAGAKVTGAPFYANGATVPGSFSSWANGAPADGAGRCGTFDGASGAWSDTSCGAAQGYVCERSLVTFSPPNVPPITCGSFGSGACAPAPTSCVPSDPRLVDLPTLRNQVAACQAASCTAPGDPGCAACVGAAAVPPPGSTCRPYPSARCGVVPGTETGPCQSSADCAAGEICGVTVAKAPGSVLTACSVCDNLAGAGGACTNPNQCADEVPHCGKPEPGCEQPYDGGLCNEVVLCAPDGSAGVVDPRLNPGTDLDPTTFDAGGVFQAGAPPTPDYPADPACPSPPCHLGPDNHWCKYQVPTQLPPQSPGNSNPANAGGGGVIQFDFDPNLSLHYDGNPLAFGESNFDLTASASLTAGAAFDIPAVGKSTFDIIDALAMLTANRCEASTGSSHLKILGVDFLPSGFTFDTNPGVLDATACQDALDTFQKTVDRAKKALKDAQELLTQYNALKAQGAVFGYAGATIADAGIGTLCQQIAADPPAGFPAGDCANETPEATINRFIQFYTGQVQAAFKSQLALAADELKVLTDIPVNFVNNTEQQTLFEATFFIGPIPCLLQVQSVESYGLEGTIHFGLSPGALLLTQDREQLADITASVAPYANAGVSLFVGVGFDIGVASASAGVEGVVTLGNVSAPIAAGAGFDVAPQPDPRPLPPELTALSGGVPIIQPMQYQFFLDYKYGAQVDINQILAGYLAARLEISFLFFSASWTQKIVDFGNGITLPPINLVSGDGTTPALGSFPWATVQMPTPFVSLQPLPVPATPVTTAPDGGVAPVATFDAGQVEKLFYDTLCTCVPSGPSDAGATTSTCFRTADCCPAPAGAPPIVCFSDPAAGGAKTCESCRQSAHYVTPPGGCPPGQIFCGTLVPAQSCNVDSDCCQSANGTACTGGVCVDNPTPIK